MSRLTALRLAVAATLVTACTGAAIIASQKSAATMQKAATRFLDSLSPDQQPRRRSRSTATSACAGISSPTKCSRARG